MMVRAAQLRGLAGLIATVIKQMFIEDSGDCPASAHSRRRSKLQAVAQPISGRKAR